MPWDNSVTLDRKSPAWDSSPVARVNPSDGRVSHGKHSRQAWPEPNPNSPDHHKEHGKSVPNFASGLRAWDPLPARPVSGRSTASKGRAPGRKSAHTERGSAEGRRSPTDLFNHRPSWKAATQKQVPVFLTPKFNRKGIEATL